MAVMSAVRIMLVDFIQGFMQEGDAYAFGVMLYELCTGKPAWDSKSAGDIISAKFGRPAAPGLAMPTALPNALKVAVTPVSHPSLVCFMQTPFQLCIPDQVHAFTQRNDTICQMQHCMHEAHNLAPPPFVVLQTPPSTAWGKPAQS